jgi:hypothetical protein
MSGNAAIVRLAELFAKAAIAQARADMETQQPQGRQASESRSEAAQR